jgi:hypothetical protein
MNNKIIYGIIYGTIILCIVFIILIATSVLSTGNKYVNFFLEVFLLAIGLYLMYKNIETAKVAPDPNPNSSSGIVDNENLDNENIDKTLSGVQEMLEVKMKYEIIISKFELSLSNMKKLKNNEYLEKYTKYKNKINTDLQNLLDTQTLDHNKKLLTGLINANIYIQTINKYNDKYKYKNSEKIDENYDNINQLFNHFINYFIKMFNTNPVNYESLYENLIKDLNKLNEVILSMKDNDRYILQFNTLIKIARENKELKDNSKLKNELDKLKIDKKAAGEGDSKIMQCLNLIKLKLKPIDNLDMLKIRSYNNLINITNTYINNNIDWHTYVNKINPLFDNFDEKVIINWINTCKQIINNK